ncbi:hypothetical protein [Aliiruegeria sabulilitoris]|uniref:hypothetical protein n=1 Tax=Aliiruegeria sabulilitoris TaxID=1510458 RepID=UPI00082B39AA|nr:hypothetical protein [Aliiruegeria sabulilitoris]
MPNTVAYIVLFAWPAIAFLAFRRLPLAAGVSAALICAFLLLPAKVEIDLPMLPSFDKGLSGIISALLLMASASRPGLFAKTDTAIRPGWLPRAGWSRLCMLGALVGSMVTVLLNSEPLFYGPRVLPGLQLYDGLASILNQIIVFLPFLIARKVLATAEAQRLFLLTLVIAAVIYAFPALYEVRMSPQLNRTFYGFFPASFAQHMREGGFRPLVFLHHGLVLSLFLALGFLGALACLRYLAKDNQGKFIAASLFLFVALYFSKSLGAFASALLFAPIVLIAPARLQLLFAAAVAAATLSYPIMRGNDLVPIEPIAGIAQNIDAERAASLRFRVENEDALLAKANQKPFFGWGGWGRPRVYDADGRDVSITDGAWVILFGHGGWALYLSTFGLLCMPVLLTAWFSKSHPPDGVTIALTLLLCANMIDLLPNSGLLPITWMMAGALAGRLERHLLGETKPGANSTAPAGKAAASGLYSPAGVRSVYDSPNAKGSPFTLAPRGTPTPEKATRRKGMFQPSRPNSPEKDIS